MSAPRLSEAMMRQVLGWVEEYGTITEASKALGMARETLQSRYNNARLWQASRGEIGGPPIPLIAQPPEGFAVHRNNGEYDADGNLRRQWVATRRDSGETFEVPAGHVVKGVSALLDADGRVAAQWVKTTVGGGEGWIDALRDAMEAHTISPIIPSPAICEDDTLTIYPLADLHIGMYAWGPESGSDYDVEIATDLVKRNISALVSKSNPSSRAIILGLGDLFHQNDQKNATPGSGHRLDVDGRWRRVYRKCSELMLDIVDIVAAKHDIVEVVFLPGNHDEDASVCFGVSLALYYRMNPRINVYESPGLHWYGRFGKCMFGATHGHTMKPDRMAMMLAADRKQDWGETDHKHFFFGHVHHESAKEVGPVRVESFNTPAARDAYAQGGGYRSSRSMSAITFHREEGEIGRHRVNISNDWAKIVPAIAA